MPSPLGHSLAGVALLQMARRAGVVSHVGAPLLAGIVVATNTADLDFVAGMLVGNPEAFHHGISHSLCAAALFGLGAGLIARWMRRADARDIGVLIGLAYVSHLVLDMLSTNGQPPQGVPLFWPLSATRFNLPLDMFLDIKRQAGAPNFFASLVSWHNVRAVVREALIMGGCVGALRLAGLGLGRSRANQSSA